MKAKQIKYIKFWYEKNAILRKYISNKISSYSGNIYHVKSNQKALKLFTIGTIFFFYCTMI